MHDRNLRPRLARSRAVALVSWRAGAAPWRRRFVQQSRGRIRH